MKKQAVYWSLGFFAFSVVVVFLLFKNRPTDLGPKKIIKPTYFETEGRIGRVVARRFYTHVQDADLVIVGSSPLLRNYEKIWYEFVKASMADGNSFEHLLTIQGLRPISEKDEIVSGELPDLQAREGRVILQVPSDEFWKAKVMRTYPDAELVFFQVPFSLFEERRQKLGLNCKGPEDQSFFCLSERAATRYYRKKLTENRLTAMMEQHDFNFYLLMVGEAF